MDFEKRIAAIYQKCRTPEQIQFEFDQLQRDLDAEIAEGQRDAREKLLDNFDQEVVEKVRIQSQDYLDRFNERLWLLTRYLLAPYAGSRNKQHALIWREILSLAKPSIPVPIVWGGMSRTPTPTGWATHLLSVSWKRARGYQCRQVKSFFIFLAVGKTSRSWNGLWARRLAVLPACQCECSGY